MRLRQQARLLSVVLAALAAASAAYERAGEVRNRRRNAPPGRLVHVGGHRLHITCAGDGTPAVVIIPALGGVAAGWLPVQRALSSCTTVCAYDRAGLGWSEGTARWPAANRMARELRALLDAAGIAPPFVLAGHSLGGLVALKFTQMYPHETAGLVLIDSSHPEQSSRLPKKWLRDYRGGKLAEVALDFAQPLGLRRMLRSLRRAPAGDGAAALALSSRSRRAGSKELLAFDATCRDTAVTAGCLGDLPLAVITSSERDPHQPEGSRAQRDRVRFYLAWAQLQDELAALSVNSVHVVAPSAGHHVHRDDLELVVKTIAELVQRIRQS